MAGWPQGEARKRSNACWTSTVKAARGEQSTCRRQGIPVTTLDYYHRRETLKAWPQLARVKLTAPANPAARFALVLRNGRRIESAWNFRDADLSRLIRVAEAE